MALFDQPFGDLNPGESKILPEADMRQGLLIANLRPLARLFKHPAFGDLEARGEFCRSEQILGIEPGHFGLAADAMVSGFQRPCRNHAFSFPFLERLDDVARPDEHRHFCKDPLPAPIV